MKIRNSNTPKPTPPKRTPPARKAAARTPPNPPDSAAAESATPKPTVTKRGPATRAKQAKSGEMTPSQSAASSSKSEKSPVGEAKGQTDASEETLGPTPDSSGELETPKRPETRRGAASRAKQVNSSETTPNTGANSKPEQPSGEEGNVSADAAQVTPVTRAVSGRKTRGKRAAGKAKTPPAKAASTRTPKSEEVVKEMVEESIEKEAEIDTKDADSPKKEESAVENVTESAKKGQGSMEVEEHAVEDVGEFDKKEQSLIEVEEPVIENVEESLEEEQTTMEIEVSPVVCVGDSLKQEAVVAEVAKSPENEESGSEKEGQDAREEMNKEKTGNNLDANEELKIVEPAHVTETVGDLEGEDAKSEKEEYSGDEGMEYGDRLDLGEHGEEDLGEDDVEEPVEEPESLEEEHRELTAIAKERKMKKEHEIFIGGLDQDATEEDVRMVFEKIGEVVEVRLHKNLSSTKSKGYAFVKFANKEHAKWALSEMKNPLICGKRCGTAPSEDNDTLFVGNICNTWTKEAIKLKLKDYGVEGVENITLVPDVQHEGLSRGFAFIEFSCHADAMLAYKRLQKPDVIFGHPERTAKVAFAEPLREPDPGIMATVKSVFLDGLPPHWDEERVREKLKGYGEIVRIVVARNMSTAKRKDFGFVDFSTHEAAMSCIDGINSTELGDGNLKTKVRARLSNPLPKTQAVKGGMSGGYRIGHGGGGTISRFGRGFGQGGHHFNRANFQRGRNFYQRGRGLSGRMSFAERDFDNAYAEFHRRQFIGPGGRRGSFRGGRHTSGGGAAAGPSRPNLDRPWHAPYDMGHGRHVPFRRPPYMPEEGFDRPFPGRHFDDPYLYGDIGHGIKRPFYVTDRDADYMEPGRLRQRLDYTDRAVSFHGTRFHDTSGADSGIYSDDYYGSDYGGGAYSSYYGGNRPYGGGYH